MNQNIQKIFNFWNWILRRNRPFILCTWYFRTRIQKHPDLPAYFIDP